MKRYYISPIVGTGAEDDPYRPKVADYGVSWVGVIPSNPDTGRPVYPWCLALVEAINHASLLADRDIKPLPDFPLDGKVSAINKATRNRMSADLQGQGIDTSFIGSADGYRDVIRGIGRSLAASFDENGFDVA